MGLPTIDELEIAFLTGKGIAIIVEGNSYEHDPWFYKQWFDNYALQVAFFPQNGWPLVVEAVAELRRRCQDVPIYGIIDRDFAEDGALDADFAQQGILRTPRYTLENYLLEPDGWAKVFSLIFRGRTPDGWDESAQVQTYIEQAYHHCLPLAVHDKVIQYGNRKYSVQAKQTPEDDRRYLKHINHLARIDPAEKLREWGQQLNANEDLGALYEEWLGELEQDGWTAWQCHVSGKHVLEKLRQRFPPLPTQSKIKLYYLLSLYIREYPDPPDDLAQLIERIIEHAHS